MCVRDFKSRLLPLSNLEKVTIFTSSMDYHSSQRAVAEDSCEKDEGWLGRFSGRLLASAQVMIS